MNHSPSTMTERAPVTILARRGMLLAVAVASVLLALLFVWPWNDAGADCWHYDGHGERAWYDGDKPGC